MPDVRGEDGDTAEDQLESDLGLVVTQQEDTCPGAIPPGVVCDQSPAPGTPVEPGDSATLIVQTGEASVPSRIDLALAFFFFGFA